MNLRPLAPHASALPSCATSRYLPVSYTTQTGLCQTFRQNLSCIRKDHFRSAARQVRRPLHHLIRILPQIRRQRNRFFPVQCFRKKCLRRSALFLVWHSMENRSGYLARMPNPFRLSSSRMILAGTSCCPYPLEVPSKRSVMNHPSAFCCRLRCICPPSAY